MLYVVYSYEKGTSVTKNTYRILSTEAPINDVDIDAIIDRLQYLHSEAQNITILNWKELEDS